MRNGPVIQTSFGPMQWSAPIDYGKVVFDGAGLFPGPIKFHDASARGLHGTMTGPVWRYAPGIGRWAQNITLDTQYTTVPHNTALNFQEPMCWSWWFNAIELTDHRTWWSKGSYNFLFYRVTAGRELSFYCSFTSGVIDASAAADYSAGVWHHVLWYVSDVPRLARVWFNGTELTVSYTGAAPTGSPVTNTVDMRFGRHATYENSVLGEIADPLMFHGQPSDAVAKWLANRANNPWQPYKKQRYWLASAAPATLEINVHDCTDTFESLH